MTAEAHFGPCNGKLGQGIRPMKSQLTFESLEARYLFVAVLIDDPIDEPLVDCPSLPSDLCAPTEAETAGGQDSGSGGIGNDSLDGGLGY